MVPFFSSVIGYAHLKPLHRVLMHPYMQFQLQKPLTEPLKRLGQLVPAVYSVCVLILSHTFAYVSTYFPEIHQCYNVWTVF